MTLVLTYHAVEDGPAPLCVDPALFAGHARVIAASGVHVLTVSELVASLRSGALPERALAITFDDGYASVATHAARVLREHGLRATIFCVAGHLGKQNDWPTQASFAPRLPLATAESLASLAAEGWELGSHGVNHEPLDGAIGTVAECEVVESRALLAEATGVTPRTFAWPYGARPSAPAASLIARTYDAACAAGPAVARVGSDPFALPRVDIHYLRSPDLLRRALEHDPTLYLGLRRVAGRVRRALRPDHRG